MKVTLWENSEVGVTLATVTAVDRDAGENATLSFSVRRCSPPSDVTSIVVTSINSSSAVVKAAAAMLDAGHSLYECRVSVCDRGSVKSLCAVDDVIVRVHVTTDRRPRFDGQSAGYYFTVPQNQPGGTFVGNSHNMYLKKAPAPRFCFE